MTFRENNVWRREFFWSLILFLVYTQVEIITKSFTFAQHSGWWFCNNDVFSSGYPPPLCVGSEVRKGFITTALRKTWEPWTMWSNKDMANMFDYLWIMNQKLSEPPDLCSPEVKLVLSVVEEFRFRSVVRDNTDFTLLRSHMRTNSIIGCESEPSQKVKHIIQYSKLVSRS